MGAILTARSDGGSATVVEGDREADGVGVATAVMERADGGVVAVCGCMTEHAANAAAAATRTSDPGIGMGRAEGGCRRPAGAAVMSVLVSPAREGRRTHGGVRAQMAVTAGAELGGEAGQVVVPVPDPFDRCPHVELVQELVRHARGAAEHPGGTPC
jgi:hypothetical protein